MVSPVASRNPARREVEGSLGEMNSVAISSRSPTAAASTVHRRSLSSTTRLSAAATFGSGSKATTDTSRIAGISRELGPMFAPTSKTTSGCRWSVKPSITEVVAGS